MAEHKNYTEWTLEALQAEEKKLKRSEITAALIVGFSAGIMIFGWVMNGFGVLYTVIPLLIIAAVVRNDQTTKKQLKEVKAEISARNPTP